MQFLWQRSKDVKEVMSLSVLQTRCIIIATDTFQTVLVFQCLSCGVVFASSQVVSFVPLQEIWL